MWAVTISLVLWSLLLWLELTLGLKVRFGPFYAIPVLLISWYLGQHWGVASAFVSAGLWHSVEMIALHHHAITFYGYWDLSSGILAFSAIALAVSWSKSVFERQKELNRELQEVLAEVQVLEGLLPICAWCRKVRDDEGFWEQIETYVAKHTATTWTHGICPECAARFKLKEPLDQHQD
jgi:hypothetical protein